MWLGTFSIGEYFAIRRYSTWSDRVSSSRHIILMSDPSGMHQRKKYFAAFPVDSARHFFRGFSLLSRKCAGYPRIAKGFRGRCGSFGPDQASTRTLAITFSPPIVRKYTDDSATAHW